MIPMRCEYCDRYCDGQCPLARKEKKVSLDLTYAENADRALKCRQSVRRRNARLLTQIAFLMLLASVFGVLDICPIRGY